MAGGILPGGGGISIPQGGVCHAQCGPCAGCAAVHRGVSGQRPGVACGARRQGSGPAVLFAQRGVHALAAGRGGTSAGPASCRPGRIIGITAAAHPGTIRPANPQPHTAAHGGTGSHPAPTITIPPGVQTTAPILDRTFGQGSGQGYIALAAGSIKNATDEPDSTIATAAQGALPFTVTPGSPDPQVLILHTHATETYQTWDTPVYDPDFTARTKDTTLNMCAVGEAMTKVLNDAGITTLHDTTLHDSPSYTESYARSAQTARRYLEEYPSIKVVLDVHRDAMESGDARVRPLTTLDGQPTAQVMIIAGCNNGGTVQLPNWRLNLCFAAKWEERMEMLYPGLTRPVLCGYRFYNQDVSPGALLIEIGGHANTVQQAVRAGQYAAKALAALFGGSV